MIPESLFKYNDGSRYTIDDLLDVRKTAYVERRHLLYSKTYYDNLIATVNQLLFDWYGIETPVRKQ